MPKVLGINCSPRRYGNSDVLLQEALLSAGENGAAVEYLRLADYRVKACRGCLSCVFTGVCAIKDDDLPLLWDKMRNADGLLVAAPTYFFSPAGPVKMLIDRAFIYARELDEVFRRNRVAATISVAGNSSWNPLGATILNVLPLAYGYRLVDYLEAYATGPGEVLLNDANAEGARRLGAAVVAALRDTAQKRPPAPWQCPVCYSESFHLDGSAQVTCCTCGTKGTILPAGSGIQFTADPDAMANHLFAHKHRRSHLDGWVLPSKDKFLANRAAVREKLRKYKDIQW